MSLRLVTREQAVEKLQALAIPGCLMCAFGTPALAAQIAVRTKLALVVVPRFVLRPGHTLVVLREHVTTFTQAGGDAWAEATELARRVAIVMEQAHRPSRCYVASLGAGEDGVPMSSPHLHLHVVPVQEPDARPHDVFTWRNGVYEEDDESIAARAWDLADRLK